MVLRHFPPLLHVAPFTHVRVVAFGSQPPPTEIAHLPNWHSSPVAHGVVALHVSPTVASVTTGVVGVAAVLGRRRYHAPIPIIKKTTTATTTTTMMIVVVRFLLG